jgi:hypothetical protein
VRRGWIAACLAVPVSVAVPVGVAVAAKRPAAPIPIPETLRASARDVPEAAMRRVHELVKTPFKRGIVLRPSPGESVDCPNVFRHEGRWYMLYVTTKNGVGYETRLAASDDLLTWTPLGTVLPFGDSGWDLWQADGSLALVDPEWGGSLALQPYDGRYWISYFGGSKQGYEPDPLSIGLAWSRSPDRPVSWTRLDENPVLTPGQPDARPFERATLYKSHVLWDKAESLGYPFVMYYNAKQQGPSLPWDKTYAHKPWLLEYQGVVYHFYCAVGTEGRAIALATSRELP